MNRDFTFKTYERLLEAGLEAGYEHITVRDYLSSGELPDRFIIHRHDVDRKAENALRMAKLEQWYGIQSTYYFRTIDKTLQPVLIREIEELGHEIGYHYEDMDRADGDDVRAHESFETELDRLRAHVPVDTVCMHGNPLTDHDNRDMWTGSPDFEAYDLLGEAYLSMDFVDVTYFSDTGRTWEDNSLKIKDHPIGEREKTVSANSTEELVHLIESQRFDRACILSHPNRWAASLPEYYIERAKDTSINLGKRGIDLVD